MPTPSSPSAAVPGSRLASWLLRLGDRLPAEGIETYAQGAFGVLQGLGAFGSSTPGQDNAWVRRTSVLGTIVGIFGWNYYGGDPSQLKGLGRERFDRINAKQAEELANGGETTFWKRLSLNGLLRRSSLQAVVGALAGGGAWITWALTSGYAGPAERHVRNAGLLATLALSAVAGWSVSHDFRKRVMGLDDAGNVI